MNFAYKIPQNRHGFQKFVLLLLATTLASVQVPNGASALPGNSGVSPAVTNAGKHTKAKIVSSARQKHHSAIATEPLVSCITPGITANKVVEITKPFRVLDQSADEPDPGYTGKAEFVDAQARQILVGGKPAIALLATYNATEESSRIGGQVVVLAFFRTVSGKPILMDAVDVATDRFCGFTDNPVLRYKSDNDALVIENSHFNSSENYCALTPVALVKNRLVELVKDVPTLYNAKSAGSSMVEEAKFVLGKQRSSSSSALIPLSMSIKVICKTYDQDNGEKVLSSKQKTFLIPFRMHSNTYSVNLKSKQLTALQDFVKKNGFDTP
ncbi:MAG: hypothetical protein JST44_16990 [Cyanobacteria bacterium SZAS LIN-5]|nr:hypothetical protein [Cyanobacteria bacterium SZAS LIN-5]